MVLQIMVKTGPGNGLALILHQAIITTNAVLKSIEPIQTNYNGILNTKIDFFYSRKFISKFCLQNANHFVQASEC